MSEQSQQRVKVYDAPYYPKGGAIWAEVDGQECYLDYGLVDNAVVVSSERVDGLETIILNDGRTATVQSIDLDYLPDPSP